MSDLFRDTAIGQLLHLLSGRRWLPYQEQSHGCDLTQYLSRSDAEVTSALSRWTSTCNPAFHDVESPNLEKNLSRTRSRADADSAAEKDQLNLTSPSNNTDGTASAGDAVGDTDLVTWSGPDDPANPQNWSLFKKCFVTGLICLLTFSIYIGSAIYTSGEGGIVEDFGVSLTVATLGLTLFVFGYGIGPMFLVPFSEAPPIGRTPVYIITLIIFVFLNFGVVYANIGTLLAFRFLTGFFGSPVLATGGASLADMWSNKKRAYAIGVWGLFAVCGPTMGPLLAGFAVENKDWTWSIWPLIWLSGFYLVILLFTLPETSSTTILWHGTRRMRKVTGNLKLKCQADIEAEAMQTKDIIIGALWRPFQLTFQEPILLLLDVYLGLIYALLYTWFEAFPIAFIEVYRFNLGTSGLVYLGLFVGATLIMVPYCAWLYLVQEKQFDQDGNISPEDRLPPAILGSFFIPVCLFWFGWTVRSSTHWIVPIIASSFFSAGAVLLFNSVLNYQGDSYPKYVGSVLAGNDLMRSGMGGTFPLFARALFDRLGLGWGCSLLGFLSVAFIPIPILFYVYGRRIRMASQYARHDI